MCPHTSWLEPGDQCRALCRFFASRLVSRLPCLFASRMIIQKPSKTRSRMVFIRSVAINLLVVQCILSIYALHTNGHHNIRPGHPAVNQEFPCAPRYRLRHSPRLLTGPSGSGATGGCDTRSGCWCGYFPMLQLLRYTWVFRAYSVLQSSRLTVVCCWTQYP